MGKIRCLTNNPMVIDTGFSFVEGWPGLPVVDLFMVAIREISRGYRLLTHPLTGSMGPDRNPYKSIVLTGAPGKMDYKSLEIMEQAIKYAESFTEKQVKTNWDSSTLKDFQLIDLDFIKDYLSSGAGG
ncbi:MAG: GrdX family protein [Syntrophaceticus sp.]